MKTCTHCQKEIKEEAKFCPYCGVAQEEVTEVLNIDTETSELVEEVIIEPTETLQEDTLNSSKQADDHKQEPSPNNTTETIEEEVNKVFIQVDSNKVQDLTTQSKHYLSYLNKSITTPTIGTKNTHGLFGLISYILIALFSSLSISRALGRAIGFTGVSKAFPMFFQILFLLLVSQVIYVLILMLASNTFYRTKLSWADAFDNLYTPASISVYFALASFIFSLISGFSTGLLFLLTLAVPPLLLGLSFIGNIWLIKDSSGQKNKFYITLLILFIFLLVEVFVGILFGDIINNSINMLFSNMMDPSLYLPDTFPY